MTSLPLSSLWGHLWEPGRSGRAKCLNCLWALMLLFWSGSHGRGFPFAAKGGNKRFSVSFLQTLKKKNKLLDMISAALLHVSHPPAWKEQHKAHVRHWNPTCVCAQCPPISPTSDLQASCCCRNIRTTCKRVATVSLDYVSAHRYVAMRFVWLKFDFSRRCVGFKPDRDTVCSFKFQRVQMSKLNSRQEIFYPWLSCCNNKWQSHLRSIWTISARFAMYVCWRPHL